MTTAIREFTHAASPGLAALADSWDRRVTVRRPAVDLDAYRPDLPDFPRDKVPFGAHPAFAGATPEQIARVLAGAWIWYNEKTIALEETIVNQACQLILHDAFPGTGDSVTKKLMSQTIVDEQYHVYMSVSTSLAVRERRALHGLTFPEPFIVEELRRLQATRKNEHERNVTLLAFMTVAELSINAYLILLSSDQTIQPANRTVTDNHRKDEASHANIMKNVVKSICLRFSEAERSLFTDSLSAALAAFVKPEFAPWKAILDYVGIADSDALIAFGREAQGDRPLFRDYGTLKQFASELDFGDRIAFPPA